MLDALKVLFILTGASTYLVTKYVKVGLGTKGNETTAMIGGLPTATMSPEMKEYWEKASSVLRKHYGSVAINGKSSVDSAINGRKPAIVTATASSNNNLNDDNILQQQSNNYSSSTLSATKQEQLEESEEEEDSVVEYVKPTYVIKLVEEDNKLLPKLLLQVAANTKPTDNNNEKRTKIIYFLSADSSSGDEIAGKFIVNSTTGELFLLSALDRDPPNGKPEWEMTILAKYDTSEEAFGFADIVIHLTDINDNKPVFERPVFIANISESVAVVSVSALEPSVALKVSAVDADDNETANGRVVYSLPVSNGVFAIDPKTGIVSFNCCIDRETQSKYIFEVLATDGGGLSSTATVIINIIDTNDSPPRFVKTNYTIDLVSGSVTGSEHNLDEPVLVLSVRDKDLLESNYFYCQLLDTEFLDEFLVMTNLDGSCSLFITRHLINHLNAIISDAAANSGNYTTNSSSIDSLSVNLRRIFNLSVCVSDSGPKNSLNLAANSSHSDCARVTISLTGDAVTNQTYMRRRFGDSRCSTVVCNNGGTCVVTTTSGQTSSSASDAAKHGFLCACRKGFSGIFCDTNSQTGDTVIIRFGNPAVIVILICLINVLILLLIIVIYTQTRSRVRPKTYIKDDDNSGAQTQPNNKNSNETDSSGNEFGRSGNKKSKTELSLQSVDTQKKFSSIGGGSHQSKLLSTKTSSDGRVLTVSEGSHQSLLFDTTLMSPMLQQRQQYFYYETDPYMTGGCYPNTTATSAVAPDVIVTIHQTPSIAANNSFDISSSGGDCVSDAMPCVVFGGSGGGEDYQSSLSSSNAPTVTGVCCYGNNCEKDKCAALAQQLKKSSLSLNSIGTQLQGKMTTV